MITASWIVQKSTFAKEKAKEMMGAGNPLTGSEIRKPASTFCSGCGRWHRPGNVCPNTMKSHEPLIWKGDVIHGEVFSGNPYRAAENGQFGAHPGGPDGLQAKGDCLDSLGTLQTAAESTGPEQISPPAEMAINQPTEQYLPQMPPPTTLNPGMLLNQQVEQKMPPTYPEAITAFNDGSQHLQNQMNSYLQALRNWNMRYGG